MAQEVSLRAIWRSVINTTGVSTIQIFIWLPATRVTSRIGRWFSAVDTDGVLRWHGLCCVIHPDGTEGTSWLQIDGRFLDD